MRKLEQTFIFFHPVNKQAKLYLFTVCVLAVFINIARFFLFFFYRWHSMAMECDNISGYDLCKEFKHWAVENIKNRLLYLLSVTKNLFCVIDFFSVFQILFSSIKDKKNHSQFVYQPNVIAYFIVSSERSHSLKIKST